jgi:hypothetical protein
VTHGGNFGLCYEGLARHGVQQDLLGCQQIYAAGVSTDHPIYSYDHLPDLGSSIVGGVFYDGTTYPPEYHGRLLRRLQSGRDFRFRLMRITWRRRRGP